MSARSLMSTEEAFDRLLDAIAEEIVERFFVELETFEGMDEGK